MWVLVYIAVINMEVISVNAMGPRQTFENMYDCFEKREQLAITVGGTEPGYFPPGTQGICVYIGDGDGDL